MCVKPAADSVKLGAHVFVFKTLHRLSVVAINGSSTTTIDVEDR